MASVPPRAHRPLALSKRAERIGLQTIECSFRFGPSWFSPTARSSAARKGSCSAFTSFARALNMTASLRLPKVPECAGGDRLAKLQLGYRLHEPPPLSMLTMMNGLSDISDHTSLRSRPGSWDRLNFVIRWAPARSLLQGDGRCQDSQENGVFGVVARWWALCSPPRFRPNSRAAITTLHL